MPEDQPKVSIEDLRRTRADAEQHLAGLDAFLWLARDCGPSDDPFIAVESVRRKENKTPEETVALDTWDRVKNKPTPRTGE
jgi:hypothetical protein